MNHSILLTSSSSTEAFVQDNYNDLFCKDTAEDYLKAIRTAARCVTKFLQHNTKPFSGIAPDELRPAFEGVDLDDPLPDYESLLEEVETLYTRHAVGFHLPSYVAHLNCPVVIPAVAAEVLISAINTSMDTWDQSGGGTLIEQKLIAWTCRQLGFDPEADGVFTGGGTQSNLMGMLLARDRYVYGHLQHDIKQEGLPVTASRFRIFVSEMAHFSVQKSAALLGLGHRSVIKIKVDSSFRMDVRQLEAAILRERERGNIPIAVVATAGTTDFGSVDPLMDIGRLAARYGFWYHVDAAYGCGLLLTDKHKNLLEGIEQAHSVTVDYHKSFFQSVSSSAFLVRNKRYLRLVTHHADYPNPEEQDKEGWPNQVNKSLQTTRRFDALKLWFTLRLMGREKLGGYIETIVDTAAEVVDIIEADSDFELLNRSDISALVFRYRPDSLQEHSLCEANRYIRKSMLTQGEALLAGTKYNDSYYLKFTLLNPLTTVDRIREILQMVKKHGTDYVLCDDI